MRSVATEVSPTRRAARGPRRGPMVWVAAVLVVLVVVGPMFWYWLDQSADQRLIDLAVYRAAGESLLTGRPVYDYLTPLPQLLAFTYPPVAAVLAIPLVALPNDLMNWAWNLAQLAALAVLVSLGFRAWFDRVGATRRPLAFAAVFCAMAWVLPVRDGLRFGQVGLFLAVMCVTDCMGSRPRWPRGLLIGLATAIKLTPGVFIVYLLVVGRRRHAAYAAAWAALFTGIGALVAPDASARFWGGVVFESGRLGSNDGTSNQSVRGMILRVASGPVSTLLWIAAALVVGVLGFWLARSLAGAGLELHAVTVVGLLSVLLSPVAWIHHLGGWVPLAVGLLLADGRSRRWCLAVLGITAFYAVSLPWWGGTLLDVAFLPHWGAEIVRDGFGIGAVALMFLLGRRGGIPRSPLSETVDLVDDGFTPFNREGPDLP